jgi:HSP20 family molecular chaperone IbpA
MSSIQLWDPFKELETIQNRMAGWFTDAGTFMRSFALPEIADSEHILAEFQNGVLNVKIAKKALPVPKAKTVPVK